MRHSEYIQLLVQNCIVSSDDAARLAAHLAVADEQSAITETAQRLVDQGRLTNWQHQCFLRSFKDITLAGYVLLKPLGQGGMSRVYLAREKSGGRTVAIKVLPKSEWQHKGRAERFERESKVHLGLIHRNIVRALDFGADGKVYYLVMEYVQGSDLDRLVRKKGALRPYVAAELIAQTCDALEYAHTAGIIHRDIKPANIIVDKQGVAKLVDLGLVRRSEAEVSSLTLDMATQMLGTLEFMSPEQAIDPHNVDSRADIYSLGCTLYFILTGKPPFQAAKPAQLLLLHQMKQPPPMADFVADVPAPLEAICRQMLAKSPGDRYPRAQQAGDALRTWMLSVKAALFEKTVLTGSGSSLFNLRSSFELDTKVTAGKSTIVTGRFPRPTSSAQIEICSQPCALDREELFRLLTSSSAVESTEGGASYLGRTRAVRSVEVADHLIRADLTQPFATAAAARAQIESIQAILAEYQLALEGKIWLVVQSDGRYWPVSVNRRIPSLRSLPTFAERAAAWTRMIEVGARCYTERGVTLDLHPTKFALVGARLVYLDDYCVTEEPLATLVEAITARLAEEPERAAADWQHFGQGLGAALGAALGTHDRWHQLCAELKTFPLSDLHRDARDAILAGMDVGRSTTASGASLRRLPAADAAGIETLHRICVLSDIHANLPALDAVLAAAEGMHIDGYLILGDIVGFGPHPRACVDRVRHLPKPAAVIAGDHDEAVAKSVSLAGAGQMVVAAAEWTRAQLTADDLAWLADLPREIGGQGWIAVHGALVDPRRCHESIYELTWKRNLDAMAEAGWQLCFFGHTHVQIIYRRTASGDEKLRPHPVRVGKEGEIAMLNPGSVGQPRDGDPAAAFAIWDRDKHIVTFHRAAYALAETVAAINAVGLPSDFAYRLEIGR